MHASLAVEVAAELSPEMSHEVEVRPREAEVREAQIIIEKWRHHYDTKRLHSALGGIVRQT